MSAKLKWTPERLEQLHALVEAGKSRPQIARELGESYDSVVSALVYHKIPHKLATTRWTDEAIQDVLRRLADGKTVEQVASDIQVHPGTLQSILQQRSVDRRESIILSQRKRLLARQEERYRQHLADQYHRQQARDLKEIERKEKIEERERLIFSERRRKKLAAQFDRRVQRDRKRKLDHPVAATESFQFRNSLISEIHKMVPRGIPSAIRDDIRQEIVLAVLEGALLTADLVKKITGRCYKEFRFDHISLDECGSDRSLHEVISTSLWEQIA